MNTSTETLPNVFPNAKLNRQQRRAAMRVNHRNHVRQVIPAKIIWDDKICEWVEIPEKVIFHKKKSNLPRLYPNMSRIKGNIFPKQ